MVFGRLDNLLGKKTRSAMSALQLLVALPAATEAVARGMPPQLTAVSDSDSAMKELHNAPALKRRDILSSQIVRIQDVRMKCSGLSEGTVSNLNTPSSIKAEQIEKAYSRALSLVSTYAEDSIPNDEFEQLTIVLDTFLNEVEQDLARCQPEALKTSSAGN